ncbi:MAG: hypothetical protein RL468_1938 [Pseudomonadota bacterium]
MLQQILQAQQPDAIDLAQAFLYFAGPVIGQALLEQRNDARARMATHRDDEGKTKLGVVVCIEFLQSGKFLRLDSAVSSPRTAALPASSG